MAEKFPWDALRLAQVSLAQEIMVNPDKSWRATVIDRYKAFLRDNGASDVIVDPESWPEGTIEVTEAVLRSVGRPHQRAA